MIQNPFSLENKTVLVTGASSGIGRAIAIECSKAGATLVITGRNPERLNDTFKQLEGSNHSFFVTDLQIEDQTILLVENSPLLDGVVHSAGVINTAPFQYITEEKLNEIFSINFILPTLLSKTLIKQKKIKNGASIVWISSIAGSLCVSYGRSLYSATKSAVNGMTKSMALELSSKGIRVNSVNPGVIDTNVVSESFITQEQWQEEVKKYPLKRYGKPKEVAYATIYLLSDASAWVTGTHLIIDGGFTLL
jgi:NAD(P)-dependent dehydrogenase (short-subunit alcohol dehydrogenase family)